MPGSRKLIRGILSEKTWKKKWDTEPEAMKWFLTKVRPAFIIFKKCYKIQPFAR